MPKKQFASQANKTRQATAAAAARVYEMDGTVVENAKRVKRVLAEAGLDNDTALTSRVPLSKFPPLVTRSRQYYAGKARQLLDDMLGNHHFVVVNHGSPDSFVDETVFDTLRQAVEYARICTTAGDDKTGYGEDYCRRVEIYFQGPISYAVTSTGIHSSVGTRVKLYEFSDSRLKKDVDIEYGCYDTVPARDGVVVLTKHVPEDAESVDSDSDNDDAAAGSDD
jgi:hypothetical protein